MDLLLLWCFTLVCYSSSVATENLIEVELTEGCYGGWKRLAIGGECEHDINECTEGTHLCGNAVCVNTYRNSPYSKGYNCKCDAGYAFRVRSDTKCADIDECHDLFLRHQCPNGIQCDNKPGTYRCLCPVGVTGVFLLDSGETEPCPGDAKCVTEKRKGDGTIGDDYTCECPAGFLYDATDNTCKDFNECIDEEERKAACKKDDPLCLLRFEQRPLCGDNSSCENIFLMYGNDNDGDAIPKGYKCECNAGYRSTAYDNNGNPSCEENRICGECPEHSTCIENPDGDDSCVCDKGFGTSVEGIDGLVVECSDIDQCQNGSHTCNEDTMVCVNQNRFSDGVDYKCEDKNECVEEPGRCGTNAECHNVDATQDESSVSGYTCECETGYRPATADTTGPGFLCEDIDQCQNGSHTCNEDTMVCVNQNRFSDGVDYKCEDKNECVEEPGRCGTNAECHNVDATQDESSVSGYTCECETGYRPATADTTGPGFLCEDIDECADEELKKRNCEGDGECLHNIERATLCGGEGATCMNRIGIVDGKGYTCECDPGYQASAGGGCEDINECDDEAMHNCQGHSTCVNKNMKTDNERFVCECKNKLAIIKNDVHTCEAGTFMGCVDGMCYFFSSNPPNPWEEDDGRMTWFEGRAYCKAATVDGYKDWTLASIHTQAQNDLVLASFKSDSVSLDQVWIGLSDKDTEGTFVWVDGSAAVGEYSSNNNKVPGAPYSNFKTGQPDNAYDEKEHCVEMRDTGMWNDLRCAKDKLIPVCSRLLEAIPPSSSPQESCKDGICYFLATQRQTLKSGAVLLAYQAVGYDLAKRRCEGAIMGGHDDWALASIHTEAQNTLVNGLYSEPVWIGAKYSQQEGGLVWEDHTTSGAPALEYAGESVYRNWGGSHPAGGGCVELGAAGEWQVQSCTKTRIAVCSRLEGAVIRPDGQECVDGTCYVMPEFSPSYTYQGAIQYCEDSTADGRDDWTLATIRTEDQNGLVASLGAKAKADVWIGLTSSPINDGSTTVHEWADDTAHDSNVDYENWKTGNEGALKGCASVDVNTNGKWDAVLCSESFIPVCSSKDKWCEGHNNGGCEHTCISTAGNFRCGCDDGYTTEGGNGYECLDLDECAEGVDDCGANSVCVNMDLTDTTSNNNLDKKPYICE